MNTDHYCEHCKDRADGFYGSYAAPCPVHEKEARSLHQQMLDTPVTVPGKRPTTQFKQVAEGIELGYDVFGGVDIRLGGDFIYVHINYDSRFTDNASRQRLAEQIVGLLTHPPTQPVAPAAVTVSDTQQTEAGTGVSFQQRVQPWLLECFGGAIAGDRKERNHRFLEEALELVQSLGCSESEAQQLVSYVYGRPVGDPPQEVGGVMVTLAALCLSHGMDMHGAGDTELARINEPAVRERIRAKQAAKPKHSPLPQAPEPRLTRNYADSYLAALLRYTGGFYETAIAHGMKGGETANAVAHVEKAARALHRLAVSGRHPLQEGE